MKRFPKKNFFYGMIFLVVILLLGIFLAPFLGGNRLEGMTTLTDAQITLLNSLNNKAFKATNQKGNAFSITTSFDMSNNKYKFTGSTSGGFTAPTFTFTKNPDIDTNNNITFKSTPPSGRGPLSNSTQTTTYTINPVPNKKEYNYQLKINTASSNVNVPQIYTTTV
jgi:hypothetical protein